MHEAANVEQVSWTVVVEDVSSKRATCKHEERFDRRDPRDGTSRILSERHCHVVFLKYSYAIDPSGMKRLAIVQKDCGMIVPTPKN